MKWLSCNCRGLARPAKKLALTRLLELEKLDVIFLQETLGVSYQITAFMEVINLDGLSMH